MEKKIPFKDVLGIFAHYGFRKASMEDLARAADVSWQTLYKRFQTKEAVLDWTVQGLLKETKERAFAQLRRDHLDARDRVMQFYAQRTGPLLPLLHDSPHGSEILDLSIESLTRSGIDTHDVFDTEIRRFLCDSGMSASLDEATEKTFLLTMASKGLMMKCRNPVDFEAGMRRIVRASFPE